MTEEISRNTQAILLLTAPLITGKNASSAKLLSSAEYGRLAQCLHRLQKEPADLIATDAKPLVEACDGAISQERLTSLLNRGFLLSQAVERWHARALWVVSRADAAYPRRLKLRLKSHAPPILYGCGSRESLDRGGFAVVGSRHVDGPLIESTLAIGELAARAHKVLVSGGAKGIDQAAMTGALEAGGQAVGVLADSLEKSALKREHRAYIQDGRLTLISPYDPSAGFNVGHAMQRNKLIYGLSDASLVMSSDLEKGGTWAGAIEQLERLHFVPVYVRAAGETSSGLNALLTRGGIAWPEPEDVKAFEATLEMRQENRSAQAEQPALQLPVAGPIPEFAHARTERSAELPDQGTADAARSRLPTQSAPLPLEPPLNDDLAERLFGNVRQVFHSLLSEPTKEVDVALRLQISKAQARLWLKRLLDEGSIVKSKKPPGYMNKASHLFEQ